MHQLLTYLNFKYLPSMNAAPTSSKSLLASNFKSEPTEIQLYKIMIVRTRKKYVTEHELNYNISQPAVKTIVEAPLHAYISCNLKLTVLSSSHGAKSPILTLQLFDLYPHQHHLQQRILPQHHLAGAGGVSVKDINAILQLKKQIYNC